MEQQQQQQQQQRYITLRQAEELAASGTLAPNTYRDLFAVVTECTVPRPTSGTGEWPARAGLSPAGPC